MKIVVASSEAIPFAKTGGLADVASALSKALADAGHEVSLFLPCYPQSIAKRGLNLDDFELCSEKVTISVGSKEVEARLRKTGFPGSSATVYLVEQARYFDRPELYHEGGRDYQDNCERFIFFSRAVMEFTKKLNLSPDIIHANDWQTGLIPALLNIEYEDQPGFEKTAAVYTIHNMAFQGQYWHWDMLLTGIDWKYFNRHQMEFFGQLNLLKTGIVFSDMVTTVSPTYAKEIRTEQFGYGLHGVLDSHSDRLVGILNGVDTTDWNPEIDPHIAANYSAKTVTEGKPRCKAALQERMGLPQKPDVPLLGAISRMTDQKGFSLILDAAENLLATDVQLVILGTGDPYHETSFSELARRFPDKVSTLIGFDEILAHQIEAGLDIFLMPSQFEPCGLNQMYSLIYGTVPIVHEVGGLADSVVDASDTNLENGTANGFSFWHFDATVLYRQMRRAIDMYNDKPTWQQLMQNGMTRDWSWKHSAQNYLSVYQQALSFRANSTESVSASS
ncbi:glycogen synthase GlgA [Gimesia chilikensis]|uniref:Glycogen synthase n=1 Tax=Gimesia chilikensis TaxID=2605989 RepID=A0A517PTP0_9PLAN|nr:glycogen synthase GlgA [Gimesia chilikensis]QDT22740.1 Glycogen synthase [Gimesia chilikensis]